MEFNALVFQKTNLNNYYRMQVFFLIFQTKNIIKFSHHHDEVNKKLIENIQIVQTWRQKVFLCAPSFHQSAKLVLHPFLPSHSVVHQFIHRATETYLNIVKCHPIQTGL